MTTDDDMREIEASLDKIIGYAKQGLWEDGSDRALLALIRQKLPQADAEHERAVADKAAMQRLREKVDAMASAEGVTLGEWRSLDRVLDWIDDAIEAAERADIGKNLPT